MTQDWNLTTFFLISVAKMHLSSLYPLHPSLSYSLTVSTGSYLVSEPAAPPCSQISFHGSSGPCPCSERRSICSPWNRRKNKTIRWTAGDPLGLFLPLSPSLVILPGTSIMLWSPTQLPLLIPSLCIYSALYLAFFFLFLPNTFLFSLYNKNQVLSFL